MAPGFGAQAAVPGFTVYSHSVKIAPGTLEGLQGYFIVVAVGRQFQ